MSDSPDELVARAIVAAVARESLVSASRLVDLERRLVAGSLRPEDFARLAESIDEPSERSAT